MDIDSTSIYVFTILYIVDKSRYHMSLATSVRTMSTGDYLWLILLLLQQIHYRRQVEYSMGPVELATRKMHPASLQIQNRLA